MNESFDDGNFTAGPAWTGTVASWQIVGSDVAAGAPNSNTLRLNVPAGSGIAYLSSQVMGAWGIAQRWAFFVGRRAQAYTATNYALIWLWCSEADLTAATADGYRLRIGDDSGGDEIVLQRVTDGVATNILVSAAAIPNNLTDVGFLLRVTRSANGAWELFTSPLPAASGSGAIATDEPSPVNTPVSQGSATDNLYHDFDNGFMGFANAYGSTSTARTAQEYDQVQLSFVPGVLPAKLRYLKARTDNGLTTISWQALLEQQLLRYEVLKSNNGLDFRKIASVPAEQKGLYVYTDSQYSAGSCFYRLRMVDGDGTGSLSYVVAATGNAAAGLRVFPNPATTIVTAHHPSAGENGRLLLMTVPGIRLKEIQLQEHSVLTEMDISGLSPGLYYLLFISGGYKIARMFVKT